MARTARLILPHQPHHLYLRGNNRQDVFLDEADYLAFLEWLRAAARDYDVAVHAYALFENCVHLLATPCDDSGLGRMVQKLGRQYVPYFNRKYKRSGTLWEGRFKTSLIDAEHFLLKCSCFLEILPVMQGLVRQPGDYRWSSFAHHSGQRHDSLISDHALYWALGNTPFAREAAYNRLISQPISAEEAARLNQAFEKGWLVSSDAYQRNLENRLDRIFHFGKKGRPQKRVKAPDS